MSDKIPICKRNRNLWTLNELEVAESYLFPTVFHVILYVIKFLENRYKRAMTCKKN